MNLINREVLRERQKNRDALLCAFNNLKQHEDTL